MRRQYFGYFFLVLSIVLTAYGGFSIIYNIRHEKDIPTLGLIFFIVGLVLLSIFLILLVISLIQKGRNKQTVEQVETKPVVEEKEEPKQEVEEDVEDELDAEEPVKPVSKPNKKDYSDEVTYVKTRVSYRESGGSGYVKKIGYGPVLRIEGAQILDMRNNTYYMIEGNYMKRNGYGPVYEIRGSSLKHAYGGFLYEISGNNVNKVYGGYFASFSGSYLQKYDLSEKYEVPDSLSIKQKLAIVALLFGEY